MPNITLQHIVNQAAAGRNIILTARPGSLVDRELRNTFRESTDLNLDQHNLCYADPATFLLPRIKEGSSTPVFPLMLAEANVVIFNESDDITDNMFVLIQELMNERKIRGVKFPNLRSVIIIYSGYSHRQHSYTKFAADSNKIDPTKTDWLKIVEEIVRYDYVIKENSA